MFTQNYETMLKRLQRLATDNAPYGTRVNTEQLYAQAYDEMVRDDQAPKLRAKYRLR